MVVGSVLLGLFFFLGTLFGRMCTFRSGPDSMPYHAGLLYLLLAVNVLVSALYSYELDKSAQFSLISLLLVAIFQFVLIALQMWALLSLFRMENRFVQLFGSHVGCDLFAKLLLLSLAIVVEWMGFEFIAVLLKLAWGIWLIAINTHLFAKGLNVGTFGGFVSSFLIIMLADVAKVSLLLDYFPA